MVAHQRSGGPKGPRNGNYKHGRYTAEAIASRRWLSAIVLGVPVSYCPNFELGQ
jgi:hypothetical protein